MIPLPQEDYERLKRSIKTYAELQEIVEHNSLEEIYCDRILLLAVMRLIDTISTNLAKTSARQMLIPIDWSKVVGIKAHLTKVRAAPQFESLRKVLVDVLPDVMNTVAEAFQDVEPIETRSDGDYSPCRVHLPPHGYDGRKFKSLFRKTVNNNGTIIANESRYIPSSLSRLCTTEEPAYERFRIELELWFQNLSEEHRALLYGRLRKTDDQSHVSAYYELFFHEYFKQRLFNIQVEPQVSIYKPDFLISNDDTSFYLEVLTAWNSIDSPKCRTALIQVLAALDFLPCNFLFSADFLSIPEEVQIDSFMLHLRQWLSTLSLECISPHEIFISDFGLNCKITAVPRNEIVSSGSLYRWSTPEIGADQSTHAVQRALKKNLKFAAFVKQPVVLAVCVRDNAIWDDISICQQLLGDVEVTSSRDAPKAVRLLHRGRGFSAERNTSISAMIFCTQRLDRSRVIHELKAIHNPWAAYPLPVSALENMPQLIPCKPGEKENMYWHCPPVSSNRFD